MRNLSLTNGLKFKQDYFIDEENIGPSNLCIPPIVSLGGIKSDFPIVPSVINPELVMLPNTEENDLLKQAGLDIKDNDKIIILKDRNGDIKSAFAYNKTDNNVDIRYIDTDKEGSNFKQGLVKLATSPNGEFLQYSKVEVVKNNIRDDLIK